MKVGQSLGPYSRLEEGLSLVNRTHVRIELLLFPIHPNIDFVEGAEVVLNDTSVERRPEVSSGRRPFKISAKIAVDTMKLELT